MATETNNKGKRFIFNSTSGLLQFILTSILIFLSIPVFLNNLGDEQYGIFCTVSVIGSLTVFANLSLDAALVKFIAEQGKCEESSYDILVTLILMTGMIFPLSIGLYVFREFILLHVLNIPQEYYSVSVKLLLFLILSNAILLLGKVFTGILDAQQKVYLSNMALFFNSLIYWGGIIVVVLMGGGLAEVGFVILLSSLAWFFLVLFLAFKEWGKIQTVDLRYNFKRIVKKQIVYSGKIYTGGVIAFLFEPLTKILISNFIGVSAVGIYEIALKIKSQFMSVFMRLLYPLFPLIAQMKDMVRIKSVINRLAEILAYLVYPLFVILVFCMYPFVNWWLGGENIYVIYISVIVLSGVLLFFSIPVVPIYFFIRAKNHAGKEIYVQATNVIVNIMLFFLFYEKYGYYAVLLGNGFAYLATFVLCLYYQKKYLDTLPFSSRKGMLVLLAYVAIIGVCAYFGYLAFNSLSDIGYILCETGVILIVTFLCIYMFKVLKKEDLNLVR